MADAEGVLLATIVHPDASPEVVTSFQSKRGQCGREKFGGHPLIPQLSKKDRRLTTKPKALAMRAEGRSIRQISAQLDIPASTIQGWLEG